MARINRSKLTKLEIIRCATRTFLEKGYTNTQVRAIATELNMSPGNLTFHFPTKEHMLAELVELLCSFQWTMMADHESDPLLAISLELAAMAAMCEENEVAKDFYLSTYISPMCLAVIRQSDAERAKQAFGKYCPGWTEERYREAELLTSGIEYAALMTAGPPVPLESRIKAALEQIFAIFQVPEAVRSEKIRKIMAMDYRGISRGIFDAFRDYVSEANE